MKTALVIGSMLLAVTICLLMIDNPRKECDEFRKATGYWIKYDAGTCFVLIDNQYLVDKDNLTATDRPAFDPEIVGIDVVAREDSR